MPTQEMIAAAIDLVIGPGDDQRDVHPVMQPELVIRVSTGPVPGLEEEGS
jgi:hypothetical protein